MTKISILLAAAVIGLGASTTQAGQLLLNGSFELPAQTTTGDHLGVVPTSWTVTQGAAASNIVRGSVTATAGTTSTTLPADPNDGGGNSQSLDINGNGTVYQNFTATLSGAFTVKVDFGGRTVNSVVDPGSFWALYDSTGTTLLASGAAVQPAPGGWSTATTTPTYNLTNGTAYRFLVNLDDADQVDGIAVSQVPEPTSLVAAGIGAGLVGLTGLKRRRQG